MYLLTLHVFKMLFCFWRVLCRAMPCRVYSSVRVCTRVFRCPRRGGVHHVSCVSDLWGPALTVTAVPTTHGSPVAGHTPTIMWLSAVSDLTPTVCGCRQSLISHRQYVAVGSLRSHTDSIWLSAVSDITPTVCGCRQSPISHRQYVAVGSL